MLGNTPPGRLSMFKFKEVFIATAELANELIKTVSGGDDSFKTNDLPIYDKEGNGIGWLMRGKRPNFKSEIKPKKVNFVGDPKPQAEITNEAISLIVKEQKMKIKTIFQAYFKENERKTNKCA